MKNDIEDIDKEFNENISNVFEINENDLEIEDFPSTVRDNNINNKLMNISGISILKDLEDKWDLIEKKKYQNEDLFKKENREEKERKRRKKILMIQSIKTLKEDFLKNIRKIKDEYENDDFEDFVFEVFKEMEKYKELNIEANKQNNNKQIKDFQSINQNYQNNQFEYNNFLNQNNHLKYKQKSFLKKDPYSEIYSNSFNNNISNKESKNQKLFNPKISSSLVGKMKNLFNDIMQPSYTTYTHNLLSNISIKVNDDISEIKKKDSLNYNENNIVEKNNFKNKNNLNSLERNFDDIYNNINPKNQRISGRNNIIIKLEKKNEPFLENDINNDSRLNEYFDKLKNKSQNKMQKYPSSNNLKINYNDIYYLNDEIKDKKFLKKMEENIQLLNRLVRINSNPNIYNEENNINPLNKSYFRNNKIEMNSSNSSKKFYNYNKIYSKNKFDTTAKILKQNSFELQKFFENNPI